MADDGSSRHCSSMLASTPSVCNSRDSVPIPITFGENGQPIGQEAAQLSSLIGRLVKSYVPPVYVVWTDVPNELKEKIWKEVSGTYTIGLIHRHHIMQRANKLWKDWKFVLRRDHIYKYLTDAERKSDVPKYVKTEDWLRFVDISSTEAALATSKVGRTARSKMKSPHTTGRKGCARVAAELKAQRPKDGSSSSPEVRSVDKLLIDDHPRRSLSSVMTAISLWSMRVAFRKASHMVWQILLATGMPTETLSRLHGVCKENSLAPLIGRLRLPLYQTYGDNSMLFDHN